MPQVHRCSGYSEKKLLPAPKLVDTSLVAIQFSGHSPLSVYPYDYGRSGSVNLVCFGSSTPPYVYYANTDQVSSSPEPFQKGGRRVARKTAYWQLFRENSCPLLPPR